MFGSTRREESVAKPSNTFWQNHCVEGEQDAFMKAIESSKVITKCYVNFCYSNFVDIQYTLSVVVSCPKADLDVHTNTSFQSASASTSDIHMSAKVCMYVCMYYFADAVPGFRCYSSLDLQIKR